MVILPFRTENASMRVSHPGLLLSLLVLLFEGCATPIENPRTAIPGSPSIEETRSKELQRLQFEDIPVPNGFRLVVRGNRSYSFQGGGVRVGLFRYWGQSLPKNVAAFYQETMPERAYGWKLVPPGRESGPLHLAFHKGQQTCQIEIKKEKDATTILVTVAGTTSNP